MSRGLVQESKTGPWSCCRPGPGAVGRSCRRALVPEPRFGPTAEVWVPFLEPKFVPWSWIRGVVLDLETGTCFWCRWLVLEPRAGAVRRKTSPNPLVPDLVGEVEAVGLLLSALGLVLVIGVLRLDAAVVGPRPRLSWVWVPCLDLE